MAVTYVRPISEVLEAAVLEVRELVHMADELQATIVLLGVSAADPAMVIGCQSADLLSQRLSGLVQLLENLALATPGNAVLDFDPVGRGLSLASQAARFGGGAPPPPALESAGELDLFDVQS
jgi:hypothetical protein